MAAAQFSYAELLTVDQQSEELSERFLVQSYIQNQYFIQDEAVSFGVKAYFILN